MAIAQLKKAFHIWRNEGFDVLCYKAKRKIKSMFRLLKKNPMIL